MGFRVVASGCEGGDCPSFHRDGEHDGADWIVRGPCASGEIDRTTGKVKELDLRFPDGMFRAMLAQL
jgi:hypothetical protein